MKKEDELFLPVPGFEDQYIVSRFGEVISLKRKSTKGGILKKTITTWGYEAVVLHKNNKRYNFRVHQLVAKAYLPNTNNFKEINHKDGNKKNNYVENLEWCDASHNMRHAYTAGLKKKMMGEENPKSKLTNKEVAFMRFLKHLYPQISTLHMAEFFEVSDVHLRKVMKGEYHNER